MSLRCTAMWSCCGDMECLESSRADRHWGLGGIYLQAEYKCGHCTGPAIYQTTYGILSKDKVERLGVTGEFGRRLSWP